MRGGNYLPCGVSVNIPLEEVGQFLHDIKTMGREITGLPVIIGGDQEGGLSNSIFRRRNITLSPLQMGLGASGNLDDVYQAASITAREVKCLGLVKPLKDSLPSPNHRATVSIAFVEQPVVPMVFALR